MAATSCRTCDPNTDAITDEDTGALVCLGCGVVLINASNNFVNQPTFTSTGALDLSGSCLVRPDLTFHERKINDATAELRSVASSLGLSSLSHEALQLARDATDGELATGDSLFLSALCAACCYIVARRHSVPLFLDEAAGSVCSDPHDIGHLVKRILCHLNLAQLPELDYGMALDQFLRTSRLLPNIDNLEEIIGQCKFLLDCATKWSLSTGRLPRPLLAAVATLVAQANGVASVSVDDFAAEMRAVISTSRTRYKELVEALAHAAKGLVPWGADLTGRNVAQSAALLIRLMELKSESDPSDQLLESFVVDTSDFLNDCNLPVREEEAEYFNISKRRTRNEDTDEHLENVKLSAECLSSTYRNVKERINNLKSSGAIGKDTEKRKRCYGHTPQSDFWVNKLDERRWKARKKMTLDEIVNVDLGFDAPPPSFITGLKLRERRRERISAAKFRIDKVRKGSDTSEEENLVEEPVCEKIEKPKGKRKGAIDGIDWEDRIIELLLLHGVNEAEIEEGQYKRLLDVGFTNEGKVLALDSELYNNGGNSMDLSISVLERAMFVSENVYDIPNMRVRGQVCFTNFPSNTAFRGFGAPQGNLIAENWIQRVAMELKKSPEEIRELNFHGEGFETHYGQLIEDCTLKQVWDELKTSCDFARVQQEAGNFNCQNRWRKRGVAMVPTKLGISFTSSHLNQAGALVQVYTDGTVLVTHGGVEMGQGLHTKIAQIAASSFNIPLGSVFISETSTNKVPNASPTAASASSDMYGAAVLDACEQIVARMQPISSRNKHGSFAELARMCHFERIDLSAHGFYITPGINFDFNVGKGSPSNYFTYGASFAEVEVDTLTGDFHTRSADVVMDLGRSLNPAIDIGQIEGAFVQGMGWIALEELKWGDSSHKWIRPGNLFTCGPGTYKIPTLNDIPLKFKVSLLKGVANPKAVHSSKAVGEPPLFLAASVLFAIKDAIIAARADSGHNEWFHLDNPVRPERIRMACLDMLTEKFIDADFRPKLSV